MTTPDKVSATYAEFARKAAVMIGDQFDEFLAGLADDPDGPALLAAWMEGQTAIVISSSRISILPVLPPDVEFGTGGYL
ncbi:hypothetical protein ABT121_43565 [Streptomyces sp. NPDC001928]|uniref:hypothetical protein n=1 Tax=Streptomyces sp. NPDC001928 TaxID=3154404 RepID=UPI00332475FF